MKRRAPESGYRSGFKPIQRKQVWNILTDGIQEKPFRHVLIMPSAEGDEIALVESKGFLREHIHVVDWNAAIVARLQRSYPGIRTYGVSLDRAFERIERAGISLDAANLDLCGHVSDAMLKTLHCSSQLRVWSDGARVVVNVLRGREKHDVVGGMLRATPDFDTARVGISQAALTGDGHYFVRELMASVYKSSAGHQTMLWSAFELRSLASVQRDLQDRYNRLSRSKTRTQFKRASIEYQRYAFHLERHFLAPLTGLLDAIYTADRKAHGAEI